jgi:hypothetical protein
MSTSSSTKLSEMMTSPPTSSPMTRYHLCATAMVAFGAVCLSGCTDIFSVDFNDPVYIAGLTPAGGPPGAPVGDVITAIGDVTVSTNASSGLGKHIRLNATTTQDAIANFIPAPAASNDNYLVSFLGSKQSNQPGVAFVEVYGLDAMSNEVFICAFAVSASNSSKTGTWAALYYADGKTTYTTSFADSAIRLDVPHRVHIRIDRVNQRVFATVATEEPNGTIVSDAVEASIDVDFLALSSVRAIAQIGSATDYRIEDMHMRAWSASAQSRAVDTARRSGLLRSRFGKDATLAEQRTLLDAAFAASPSTLRRWLPSTTIRTIDQTRP